VFEDTELAQIRSVIRDEIRSALDTLARSPGDVELLTITQAAAVAGVSERTVRQWLNTGKIPRHGVGRTVRVDKAALTRAMRLMAFRDTSEAPNSSVDEWAAAVRARGGR
jgi:excisionase family DNA binding protein